MSHDALDKALDAIHFASVAFFELYQFANGEGRQLTDPRPFHPYILLGEAVPDLKLKVAVYEIQLRRAQTCISTFFSAIDGFLAALTPAPHLLQDTITLSHHSEEVKAEEFNISRWIFEYLPDVRRSILQAAQTTGGVDAAAVKMWWPQIRDILLALQPPREELVFTVYELTAAKARFSLRVDALSANDSARTATPQSSQVSDTTPQYVTLQQMAAIVTRSKKTLERRKSRRDNPLPNPDKEGGGGGSDEWIWARIRPWLEGEFGRKLPPKFPDASTFHLAK